MPDSDNYNQGNKNSSKRLAKDLEIFVKWNTDWLYTLIYIEIGILWICI